MKAYLRALTARRSVRVLLWTTFGLTWTAAVLAGTVWLMAYDTTPGAPAQAPAEWPSASHLVRDPAGPTLVLIAHPQCDCTRASLAELAELLARSQRRPRAYVLFIQPHNMSDAWVRSGLWQDAKAIHGVTVVLDENAEEARRFGVRTSGQTLLYDAGGRLVFSGGDTRARGAEGESVGLNALLALTNGAHPPASTTPVFGCDLFDPNSAANQEWHDGKSD